MEKLQNCNPLTFTFEIKMNDEMNEFEIEVKNYNPLKTLNPEIKMNDANQE